MRHDVVGRANRGCLEKGVVVAIATSHDLMFNWDDLGDSAQEDNELLNIRLGHAKLFVQNTGYLVDDKAGDNRDEQPIPPSIPDPPGGTVFISAEEGAAPNGGIKNSAQWLRGDLSLKPRAAERLGDLSRSWLGYSRPDALRQSVKSPSPVVARELIGEQPVHGAAHQVRHRLVAGGREQL
jgi:hypothetical protein